MARKPAAAMVSWLLLAAAYACLPGFSRDALSQEMDELLPMVAIEKAEYRARFEENDFVDGRFTMTLSRMADHPGVLDWSQVRIPVSNLTWTTEKDGGSVGEARPAVWGTAPDGRTLVVVPAEASVLTGEWSLRGERFGDRTHFPLHLPEALQTVLHVESTSTDLVESSPGLARLEPPESNGTGRRWSVDLGRNHEATLTIRPQQAAVAALDRRYRDDTLCVAQRDGYLLQTDILLEAVGREELGPALALRLPARFEVQSLTLTGVPVAWDPIPDSRNDIRISVDAGDLSSRATLRIRGFQQVSWGRRRTVPRITLLNGRLVERSLSLRVEPPLQVHSLQTEGMMQTGLSSDESGGELWRFQATRPDGRLVANIDQPRPEITAGVDCLLDLRRSASWIACMISLDVEKGAAFESRLTLPRGWEPVSLTGIGTESRIAAWTMEGNEATVHWQNPAIRANGRQALMAAYIPPLDLNRPIDLQLPFVKEVGLQESRIRLLLPAGRRLEVLGGRTWNPESGSEIPGAVLRDPEITAKLGTFDPSALSTFVLDSRSGPAPLKIQLQDGSVFPAADPMAPVEGIAPELAATAAADSSGQSENTAVVCELTTSIGLAAARSSVHHAGFHFDSPWNLAATDVSLPQGVRLSSVSAEGMSVPVIRNGNVLRFPQDLTAVRHLEFTYVTDRAPGIWGTDQAVPIPQLGLPMVDVQWSLELPEELQLSEISIPNRMSERIPLPHPILSWFGPLGRGPGKSVFLPFSLQHWKQLFQGGETGFSGASHREYLLLFPSVGDSIRFSTWDAGRISGVSWVAMIACLLIGTGARMFRISWIVQITAVWLALLMVVASLLPPAVGVVCGAMVLGSVLAVLIPRRVIELRDFLDWPLAGRKKAKAFAGVAGLLLALVPTLLLSQPVATDGTPRLPASLIRSARYELSFSDSDGPPLAKATIQTLFPRPVTSSLLKLPFDNVVFPATTECLANGVRVPLIPSVNGDALLVDLGKLLESGEPEEATDEWQSVTLELEFLAKLLTPRQIDGPAESGIDAVVPRVLDSRMTIAGGVPPFPVVRWGTARPASGGGRTYDLGGVGRLSSIAVPPGASTEAPLATTILKASPLNTHAVTQFSLEASGRPETMTLLFPEQAEIHSVSGAPVADWYADSPAERPDPGGHEIFPGRGRAGRD